MARRNVIEFLITAKDQATPDINRVQGSLERVESTIKRLAATVAVVFGGREIAEYADKFRLLENRIRLVTENTRELNTVERELIALSIRARSSFEATTNLYARVARSSRELGLSQKELLGFAETVSKSIRVSGSTAAEASAGVIQFGQALASSRLSGDELRSVLEQMPRLAQAIADGLGIGIGVLREWGEEGKLTTDVVLEALRKEAPKIEAEFARITPLVSKAFVNLQSAAMAAIGEIDKAAGVSNIAATAILSMADEVINLGDALAGTLEPGQKIADITQRIAIALLTSATAVKIFINSFVDGLKFGALVVGEFAGAIAAQFKAALEGNAEGVVEIGSAFNKTVADAFVKTFTNTGDEIEMELIDLFEKIGKIMDDGSRTLFDPSDLTKRHDAKDIVPKSVRDAIREATDAMANMEKALTQQRGAMLLAANTGMDYQDALQLVKIRTLEAVTGNQQLGDELRALVADIMGLNAEAQDSAVLDKLTKELDLLRLTNRQRYIAIELDKLSENASKQQRDAVAEAAGKLFDEQEKLKTQLDFMENLAEQAARNIQDAFADFLFDPFDKGVKGMLKGFVDALRRMLAEMLAFQTLSRIPGFGDLLTRRSAGGPAFGPVLVGERGPEIVNLPRGSRVVNNSATRASLGGAMGGAQFVTNIDARGADPGLIARLPEIMDQRDKRLLLAVNRYLETGLMPI